MVEKKKRLFGITFANPVHRRIRNDVGHVALVLLLLAHLDEGDPAPEAALHLGELQTNVASADDDQVLWQDVDVHHPRVRQVLHTIETW